MAKDKWSDSEFALEAVGHRGQGHKIPNMGMYFAVLMSYEGHIAS
jgi:hypothetical protein